MTATLRVFAFPFWIATSVPLWWFRKTHDAGEFAAKACGRALSFHGVQNFGGGVALAEVVQDQMPHVGLSREIEDLCQRGVKESFAIGGVEECAFVKQHVGVLEQSEIQARAGVS